MRFIRACFGIGFFLTILFFCVAGVLAADVNTQTVVDVAPTLTQDAYRWYENLNTLTPTTALAGENSSLEVPVSGTILRLRMNLLAGADLTSGLTFRLQYSNSSSSGFADVATSTAWIFYDNLGVADGTTIATTLLTGSNVGESYNESNPTAASPNSFLTNQRAEWDWVVMSNGASRSSNWYFRMIFSSSTVLGNYNSFPTLIAISESSSTPTSTTGTGGSGGGGGGGILIFPHATKTLDGLPPDIPIYQPPSPCDDLRVQQVDLNVDCRVDLVDLSILLYYYNRQGEEIARYDFNDNKIVDFPDVSVMMFYWT